MKKNLLVLFFIALLYAGCRKEKEIVNGNLPEVKSTANVQRIDPEDMERAMNSFIEQTDPEAIGPPPEFLDYDPEDALLIVEAALNYYTCMPDSDADYDEIAADTLTFEMNLVKDLEGSFIFSGSEMNTFWAAIADSAYHASNRAAFGDPNDPFNIVVDLEFTEYDRESEESTQTAAVQVITWVGNTPSSSWNCTFTQGLDAFPAYHTCGPTTNWSIKAIQQKLAPGCRGATTCGYWSHITNPPIDFYYFSNQAPCSGGPSPCFSFDANYPSFVWYYVDPGNQPLPYYCLSPTEMACTVTGLLHLGPCHAPDDPTNLSLKLTVKGYNYEGGFQATGTHPYFHICHIKYGKCNGNPG
jgi:hypothetical protein